MRTSTCMPSQMASLSHSPPDLPTTCVLAWHMHAGAEIPLPPIAEDAEDADEASAGPTTSNGGFLLAPLPEGDEPGPASTSGLGGGSASGNATGAAGGTTPGTPPLTSRMSFGRNSVGGMSSHSRAVSLSLEHMGSSDCDEPGHHHHHHGPGHDGKIETVCLKTTKPLSLEK